MSATSQVQVRIQQLELDVQNPRIPGARDSADALNRIVSGQKGKLLRLAADIVDIGLSPGELPYVISREDDPTLFVTLDGNRRLAALKLLDNPALDGEVPFLATSEGRPLLRRLQALRSSFDRARFEPVACVLFANRDDAEPWLQRRHAGEMDGVGLAAWLPVERQRSHDPNDPMVIVSDFLRAEGLSAEEEQVIQRQWTTVQRLIDSPVLRAPLGLDLSGRVLQSRVSPDVLMRAMRAVIGGIGAMRAPSRELNSVEQREAFLRALPPGELPSLGEIGPPVPLASLRQHHATGPTAASATAGGSGATGQGAGSTSQGGASGAGSAAAQSGGATSRGSTASVRKTVFRRGELNVTAPFAKPVFDELCSIKQAEHPNAVTVLLRVFIERSMRAYANKKSMSVRNRVLPQLIGDVLNHLKSSDPALSLPSIERVVNSGQQHAQMGILNTVIHDPDAFASAADVLMIAETFRDFLKAVWQRL